MKVYQIYSETIPVPQKSKRVDSSFEEYFKLALKELDTREFEEKQEYERVKIIAQKLEDASKILEKITEKELDFSSSQTIGDYLMEKAFEIDKMSNYISDPPVKKLFKEWAFFLGIEAQKVKQHFYS
jgi:DNA repair ATPase RecN